MATTTATSSRPPPWRDVRVLRIAFQVAVLVAVVAFVAYLYDNLQANDVELDFAFLDQQAGFRIAYTDMRPSDTEMYALVTGLRNTITVAIVGIVLTLILGTLLGIARLSGNWLVRRAAGVYVEALRNVPPLLVIVFVNSAALATLPPIAVAVAGYVALDAPVVLSRPEVDGLSVVGGNRMGLPFVAVLVGLVLYTSSHVAEIVRGSIQAVPKGQTEAADAIGLTTGQRLRHVVLPQAFRIATPPIINQCLNLTKNTSLGVAVAFPDTNGCT